MKSGFDVRIKSSLSFKARKKLLGTNFLSMLDYIDVFYIHACLHALNTVLRLSLTRNLLFITTCCTPAGWHCLHVDSVIGVFLLKVIHSLNPPYFFINIFHSNEFYTLHLYQLSVPGTCTELSLQPLLKNQHQNHLEIKKLISLNKFKAFSCDWEADTLRWACFDGSF